VLIVIRRDDVSHVMLLNHAVRLRLSYDVEWEVDYE
jgi:hypothetical protein